MYDVVLKFVSDHVGLMADFGRRPLLLFRNYSAVS